MTDRQPVTHIAGVAAPLERSNVDTDAIFPVSSEADAAERGFGAALFGRWRQDPEFVLNQPAYEQAVILVAGPDFGIGSSRETAVWALSGAGFRAVLAPSFGEIFRTNCVRNGILAARLTRQACDSVQRHLTGHPGTVLTVDLVGSVVTSDDGIVNEQIEIDGFARHCLVDGLDEFELLGTYQDRIDAVLAIHETWTPSTGKLAAAAERNNRR